MSTEPQCKRRIRMNKKTDSATGHLPRKPAAVVCDMDGLLFDTETLYQEAILLAAAEGWACGKEAIFSPVRSGFRGL